MKTLIPPLTHTHAPNTPAPNTPTQAHSETKARLASLQQEVAAMKALIPPGTELPKVASASAEAKQAGGEVVPQAVAEEKPAKKAGGGGLWGFIAPPPKVHSS